ncbi:hypothetical protein [Nostoc sp.]
MPTDCSCVVTNVAIACCPRVSVSLSHRRRRLSENLKNKAIACCGRAIALQKSSKIKRSPVVYVAIALCILINSPDIFKIKHKLR